MLGYIVTGTTPRSSLPSLPFINSWSPGTPGSFTSLQASMAVPMGLPHQKFCRSDTDLVPMFTIALMLQKMPFKPSRTPSLYFSSVWCYTSKTSTELTLRYSLEEWIILDAQYSSGLQAMQFSSLQLGGRASPLPGRTPVSVSDLVSPGQQWGDA